MVCMKLLKQLFSLIDEKIIRLNKVVAHFTHVVVIEAVNVSSL